MYKRVWPLAITKFLSCFNDNAFKYVVLFIAYKKIKALAEMEIDADSSIDPLKRMDEADAQNAALVAIGSIVFILPFFFLSSHHLSHIPRHSQQQQRSPRLRV